MVSSDAQMPQLDGHILIMNSLFVSHSSALAHPGQDSWWSEHTVVQRPHAAEHSRAMKLGSAEGGEARPGWEAARAGHQTGATARVVL